MTKSTKKIIITLVVMAVIAGAVFLGYYYTTGKTEEGEQTTAKTEVEKILRKDLENDYPGTPREVMKLYGRITKCIYNSDLSTSQMEGLLEQARKLYDDELLALNPLDAHRDALLADIEEYRDSERTIMSYTAQKSSQAKTYKKDGQEYAVTYLLFITTDKNTPYAESCEKFLLRKDSKDNWKIVGWELADPDSVEIEED